MWRIAVDAVLSCKAHAMGGWKRAEASSPRRVLRTCMGDIRLGCGGRDPAASGSQVKAGRRLDAAKEEWKESGRLEEIWSVRLRYGWGGYQPVPGQPL